MYEIEYSIEGNRIKKPLSEFSFAQLVPNICCLNKQSRAAREWEMNAGDLNGKALFCR